MLASRVVHVIGISEVMSHAYVGVVAGHARDGGLGCGAYPTADNNRARITSGKKHQVCRYRHRGGVYQGCKRTRVPKGRDIHHGGKNMCLL